MNNIENFLVRSTVSVKEAIQKISETGKKAIFVVDENNTFVGLFADGDMRRYILKNGDLDAPVSKAMNVHPSVLRDCDLEQQKKEISKTNMLCYPILNDDGKVVNAYFWDDLQQDLNCVRKQMLPSSVDTVIMAGGLGRRLYPYTKVLPKALIPIGELPICTHVINNFKDYGCQSFHLILNHKKNMIKAYYSEENLGVDVDFYEETEFCGTAGGLSLLKGKMNDTFFVSNCDILVETDYTCLYKFHKAEKNLITVVGSLKDVQIPYGVIHVEGQNSQIHSLEEKPRFSFLTNVGVYVLEPEVLNDIQPGQFIHMTDLVEKYIKENKKVGVFPVSGDDWLDMGQIEEMKQMTAVLEKKMKI